MVLVVTAAGLGTCSCSAIIIIIIIIIIITRHCCATQCRVVMLSHGTSLQPRCAATHPHLVHSCPDLQI
jgi:hypothetical protein